MTAAAGLEGIVAATTRLSHVEGEKGELIIAGYRADEIAPRATYEEMLYLLWNDVLPTGGELDQFRGELASRRVVPAATIELLRAAAAANVPAMQALRMAAATLDLDRRSDDHDRALATVAQLPLLVAQLARLRAQLPLLAPRAELGHAANFLWMLRGAEPEAAAVRALDTYLNTIIDHGMNASTFTGRVIVSTESDLLSSVVGAIGALAGPLHGGAPGPVLDMLDEIGSEANIDPWLREKITRGERLMGFGHRIYKVRDPRADILAGASQALYADGSDSLYRFARKVESRAIAILAELKPGRRLQTNVEFYTALVLHGIGLQRDLFSPLFAVGRVGGWLAHAFEQRANNRLVRPQSEYAGAMGRKWVEVNER